VANSGKMLQRIYQISGIAPAPRRFDLALKD
jgi:hypothetical protein